VLNIEAWIALAHDAALAGLVDEQAV